MTIWEEKDYFANSFSCERLSADEHNTSLISSFTIEKHGKGLLTYLQQNAWKDDMEGETAVYLVKDKTTAQPVLFFSLKCGLLYDYGEFQGLSDEEREYVRMLVELRQKKDFASETELLGAIESMVGVTKKDSIIAIAQQKAEYELSEKDREAGSEVKQEIEHKVRNTYSAIELCHFCRNGDYITRKEIRTKLGFGLFWEQVMPKIEEVVRLIGSKYMYLFASDEELSTKKEEYRLINYYKTMGFENIMDLRIHKPSYDNGCFPLMQSIEEVLKLRRSIWNRYEENICV